MDIFFCHLNNYVETQLLTLEVERLGSGVCALCQMASAVNSHIISGAGYFKSPPPLQGYKAGHCVCRQINRGCVSVCSAVNRVRTLINLTCAGYIKIFASV